ncbi:MAG: S9 family peptidase [Kosmotoga sp.]|uniref:S9 family peptidase n=1 Tax=Kosmotoga sp. TaxID=1955248 RepID=UPI0025C73B8F|nr:S9 family peptidase [Kosmotoga sp.]MCD6160721.1 S9 family peptidase [Kosmotoga sp.]
MKNGYFTIEEIVSLPTLKNPVINSVGSMVAYIKVNADWDDNEFRSQVWIYDVEKDFSYPVTGFKTESSMPLWSPDSQILAYLSKAGENSEKKKQIFIKRSPEEAAIQITNAPNGVDSYKWSPDGKGFFYLSTPEDEAIKKRKELYGDFEYVDKEYRTGCLYYVSIDKVISKFEEALKTPKDMRKGPDDKEVETEDLAEKLFGPEDFFIANFAITPDSKQVLFIVVPPPSLMNNMDESELCVFDLESKKIEKLGISRLRTDFRLSPDGRKLAYTLTKEGFPWQSNNPLEILDLETGERERIHIDVDSIIEIVAYTKKGLYISWGEGTRIKIGLLDPDGKVETLTDDNSTVFWAAVSSDTDKLVCIKAMPTEPFEVYLEGKKITDEGKFYKERLTSRKQLIRWKSLDGVEIEGVLSTPPDFDPSKRYPLLLIVHGGPTWLSFDVPTFSKTYPLEQFVEKGFIVLEPNYRGSDGYGEEFRRINYRNLGIGDYADVISGVDYLIEKGIADPERIGIMGWSQGGYITAFCSLYSNRFKAASVGAGISDWITYYYATDIHNFTVYFLGETPWNDEEIYKKTSPMTYIKNASTPTLIQHGDNDQRVPVPNAYKLYQGLKDMGVPVEFVIFKEMGHGIHKPGIARAIMKQNLIWFSHYLLGEPMESFYLKDHVDD